MAKEKAQVVLSNKVWRQINWLTRNFDKEIAAVGTVEIREGEEEKYFFIDKIYFPEQKVTGATVDLESGMWGKLIQEVPVEDIGRLNFYWHRHPGSAHHSGTDEEHTFGAFMDKDANRDFFIFMQTAVRTKEQAQMDIEARIDLRNPVRASILDKSIDVMYNVPSNESTEEFLTALNELVEEFREEDKLPEGWSAKVSEQIKEAEEEPLKEELEAIIEDRVKTKTYQTSKKYNKGKWWNGRSNNYNKTKQKRLSGLEQLFGEDKSKKTLKSILEIDNHDVDVLQPIAEEEKVSLNFRNGAIEVVCGEFFNTVMTSATGDGGKITEYVRQKDIVEEDDNTYVWKLQPAQSSFYPMKETLLFMFKKFNTALKNRKDGDSEVSSDLKEKHNGEDYDTLILENDTLVYDIITELSESCDVEWSKGKLSASVYAHNDDNDITVQMGTIQMESGGIVTVFKGEVLVREVEQIQSELLHKSAQELEELTK